MQHGNPVIPGLWAGAALGLIIIILNRLDGMLGYGARELLALASMALAVAAAQWFAVRNIEGEYLPRYLGTMLTGVVAAIVYGAIAWLDLALLDPGHLERFHAEHMQRARAAAATDEQAREALAAAERMKDFITDPLSQAMVQFGTVLMIALVSGVLVAALAKRAR